MEEILGSHHTNLLLYLKKDTKPTLFFTLPSPIATPMVGVVIIRPYSNINTKLIHKFHYFWMLNVLHNIILYI